MRTNFALLSLVFATVGMFSGNAIANQFLLKSAEHGLILSFKGALKEGASIDTVDDLGRSSVALAILNNKLTFLKWMLSEEPVESVSTSASVVEAEIKNVENSKSLSPRKKDLPRTHSKLHLIHRKKSQSQIQQEEVKVEPMQVHFSSEPVHIAQTLNLPKEERERLLLAHIPGYGNCMHMAARYGTPEMLSFFYETLPEEQRYEYLTAKNADGYTPLNLSKIDEKFENWFWISEMYLKESKKRVLKKDPNTSRSQRFSQETDVLKHLISELPDFVEQTEKK